MIGNKTLHLRAHNICDDYEFKILLTTAKKVLLRNYYIIIQNKGFSAAI